MNNCKHLSTTVVDRGEAFVYCNDCKRTFSESEITDMHDSMPKFNINAEHPGSYTFQRSPEGWSREIADSVERDKAY